MDIRPKMVLMSRTLTVTPSTQRLLLAGPIPPWRGGISEHTQLTLSALRKMIPTECWTFQHLYPSFLYPGQSQKAPDLKNPGQSLGKTKFILHGYWPGRWSGLLKEFTSNNFQGLILPWWTPFLTPLWGLLARSAKIHNIPVVLMVHNVAGHEGSWLSHQASKFMIRQASGVVVHTREAENRIQEIAPMVKTKVITHPPFPGNQTAMGTSKKEARKALDLPQETKIILAFGFQRAYKALPEVVSSLSKIPAKNRPLLVIVGERFRGAPSIEPIVRKHKLQSFVSINSVYVSSRRAGLYFKAADALIAAYRSGDGSGAAAMARGYKLPIIGTRAGAGGQPDTELLSHDPQHIALGIIRFLKKLPKAARHSGSWDSMAKGLIELIEN